jgi:hypothetical protein
VRSRKKRRPIHIVTASLVTVLISLMLILVDNDLARADSNSQLTLPSATSINIALTGGPHKWAGCTIIKGVLQSDCLNHGSPWDSVDMAPADGKVYASHGGIAHIHDCLADAYGHRSFVRIDYNDGSGYQVSYEHIHNVDLQVSDGKVIPRGYYLGTTSRDSDCGGSADAPHTHMSLWHFTSGTFSFASSQAVDLDAVQVGAWLLDDGEPTQEQYTGCVGRVPHLL